jgi:hypothetical protein
MEQQQKQTTVCLEEPGEYNQQHCITQTVIVIYYVHPKCIMSISGSDRCETSYLFGWTNKISTKQCNMLYKTYYIVKETIQHMGRIKAYAILFTVIHSFIMK